MSDPASDESLTPADEHKERETSQAPQRRNNAAFEVHSSGSASDSSSYSGSDASKKAIQHSEDKQKIIAANKRLRHKVARFFKQYFGWSKKGELFIFNTLRISNLQSVAFPSLLEWFKAAYNSYYQFSALLEVARHIKACMKRLGLRGNPNQLKELIALFVAEGNRPSV